MGRTPMTTDEIAALNASYQQAITDDGDVNIHAVATGAGLSLVEWFDQSGGLYRSADGRYVFGWEFSPSAGGGFDDRIGDTDGR